MVSFVQELTSESAQALKNEVEHGPAAQTAGDTQRIVSICQSMAHGVDAAPVRLAEQTTGGRSRSAKESGRRGRAGGYVTMEEALREMNSAGPS